MRQSRRSTQVLLTSDWGSLGFMMQQLLLILFSVLFIIMQKQIIIRIQNGLFFVLKSKDFGTFNLLFTCSLVLCSNRMQRICLLVQHLQMSLGSSQMLIRCLCAPYSSVPLTTYCLTCSYGLSWFKLPLIHCKNSQLLSDTQNNNHND